MPDVGALSAEVRALLDLGLFGWFIITILALLRRWVITRGTYDEREASWQERMAQRDGECDEWRRLYEREREDRLEAQREIPETVKVLQLGINVFDQLNRPEPRTRR